MNSCKFIHLPNPGRCGERSRAWRMARQKKETLVCDWMCQEKWFQPPRKKKEISVSGIYADFFFFFFKHFYLCLVRKVLGAEHLPLRFLFTAVKLLEESATWLRQQGPDRKAVTHLWSIWLVLDLQAYWIFDTKEEGQMLNEIKCLLDNSDMQYEYFKYIYSSTIRALE